MDFSARRSGRSCSPRRDALTLLEVLAATAVISLLIALILPAVQASRESARRAECLNHLREICVACTMHESARGTFPATACGGAPGKTPRSISPHAYLLPYLEQAAVYARVDFAETGLYPQLAPPSISVNAELLHSTVPVFLCPSDAPKLGANNYRANMGIDPSPAMKPVTQNLPALRKHAGAFRSGPNGLSPASFADGLANTVLFSEKLIGAETASQYVPWRDYFMTNAPMLSADDVQLACANPGSINPPHYGFCGSTWLLGGFAQTWYNHLLAPNSQVPDCAAAGFVSGPGSYAARSLHPGGVNVGFASGTVRFVSESIDLTIWRAAATRAGGEGIDFSL